MSGIGTLRGRHIHESRYLLAHLDHGDLDRQDKSTAVMSSARLFNSFDLPESFLQILPCALSASVDIVPLERKIL